MSTTRRRPRRPRIDYSDPRVMRRRARDQAAARARAAAGPWVVGQWRDDGDTVHLAAVAIGAAWDVDPRAPLTTNVARFARWRTRQAARQWLRRHPRVDVGLVNLAALVRRQGIVDHAVA